MRDLHPFFQIKHGEGGVGKHLGKDALGIVLEESVNLLDGRVGIDEVHLETHVAQGLVEEVEGAAVNRGGADEVVARLADVQHGIHGRRLTGAGENRHHAALKVGYFLFHRVDGGIGKAGVEESVLLEVEELCHLHRGIVLIGRTLRDRQHPRLAVLWRIAGLHAFCGYFELTHINDLPL